jgi:hypothetical protein
VTAAREHPTPRLARTTLRIGVLIDTPGVPCSLHEFLRWAEAEDDIDVAGIVVWRPPAQTTDGLLGRIRVAAFVLAESIDRLFVRLLDASGHPGSGTPFVETFGTLAPDQLDLRCASATLVINGPDGSVSTQNAAQLARLNLDILIQCGATAIPDTLASLAKFGVIRFRYGDPANHLPGFWETYHHLDSVVCSIEQYSPGGVPPAQLLMRGRFSTKRLYTLTQSHLYAKAFAHLKRVVTHAAQTREANAAPGSTHPAVADSNRQPRAYQSMLYLLKVLFRLLQIVLFKFIQLEQRWSISILDAPWRQVELPQGLVLRPPRSRFWADPFLYERDRKLFCFFEEFDYHTGKGHISVSEVQGATAVKNHGKILNETFHLSFPYIFEFAGEIFMCPECEATRTIRLYRVVEFPRIWRLAHVLMENVAAVDTMIFKHVDKWWMLTNMDCSGGRDYGAELYVFYAESPLSKRWIPHPQNPVKIDCEGGRNGGMITEAGKLFRIGQRQALAQYGRGISVYEIEVLDEVSYRERLVTEIIPAKTSGILGLHHLTVAGGRTAVDFARREWVLWS